MRVPSDTGGSDTLVVFPGDLKDAAQKIRNINTNANISYQLSYNQLMDSISLLPGSLQNWATDSLHTWNKYIQNQVFDGNDQIATALNNAAESFQQGDNATKKMFEPQ